MTVEEKATFAHIPPVLNTAQPLRSIWTKPSLEGLTVLSAGVALVGGDASPGDRSNPRYSDEGLL